MVYETRSRRHRPRQASQRRTDKRQGPRTPVKNCDGQRGKTDSTGRASHTSAIFAPPDEDSSSSSDDEPEVCSPPTRSHPSTVSSPSKARRRAKEDSIVSFPKPGRELEDHRQLGHVPIVHYKHNPPKEGTKSRPIKIEDSPEISPLSPIRPRHIPSHQECPASLTLHPEGIELQHSHQTSFDSYIDDSSPNRSPSKLFSSDPAVQNIVTSVNAARHFLRCFLTREKHWLKSRDEDSDPDNCFWWTVKGLFKDNCLGYQIDGPRTAREIAAVLCSENYRARIKQALLLQDDQSLSRLISDIDDCHDMCQRRTLQQQSDVGSIQTTIAHRTTKEDVQDDALRKPITSIDGYNNCINALAEKEENKPVTTVVGVQATNQGQQKQVSSKPYSRALHSNTRSTNQQATKPNIPKNAPSAPKKMRENHNTSFRQRGGLRRQDGPSHSSRRPRKQFGGVPSTVERTQGYRRSRQQFKATNRGGGRGGRR